MIDFASDDFELYDPPERLNRQSGGNHRPEPRVAGRGKVLNYERLKKLLKHKINRAEIKSGNKRNNNHDNCVNNRLLSGRPTDVHQFSPGFPKIFLDFHICLSKKGLSATCSL